MRRRTGAFPCHCEAGTVEWRSVQLDDLDVCLDGGIELTGLKIGAPRSVGDPWLEAKRIQIDVSLWQLLWGKFEPTNLQADEATLRVLRRKDGSFELADLVRFDGDSTATSSAEPHRCGPSKLNTKVRQTRILLIDQPSQTQLTFDEVEGEGIWEGEGAFVATLSGRLNQGPFEFTAHLDRSGGQPNFEGQFRTSDVVLDQGMSMLRYLVPVLAGAGGQLQGRMAMDVYLRGRGECREVLGKSLVGNGSLVLDPIELNGTPLMTEFAKLAELSSTDNLASIRSDFVVQDGRIKTDHLTLTAGRIPVAISGWTDFDGRLDYQVKLDGVADRIPDQARKFISGLDLDLNSLTSLRLRGNVDRVVITACDRGRRTLAAGADHRAGRPGTLQGPGSSIPRQANALIAGRRPPRLDGQFDSQAVNPAICRPPFTGRAVRSLIWLGDLSIIFNLTW